MCDWLWRGGGACVHDNTVSVVGCRTGIETHIWSYLVLFWVTCTFPLLISLSSSAQKKVLYFSFYNFYLTALVTLQNYHFYTKNYKEIKNDVLLQNKQQNSLCKNSWNYQSMNLSKLTNCFQHHRRSLLWMYLNILITLVHKTGDMQVELQRFGSTWQIFKHSEELESLSDWPIDQPIRWHVLYPPDTPVVIFIISKLRCNSAEQPNWIIHQFTARRFSHS